MFRVNTASVDELKSFLNLTFSSTVTFRVRSHKLQLIISSAEACALYSFKDPVSTDDISFCIDRTLFQKVLYPGYFLCDVKPDGVAFHCYNESDVLVISILMPKKMDIPELYENKTKLLTEMKTDIAASSIAKIINLCRAFNAPLQIQDGVAVIALNQNLKIFKKLDSNVSDICVRTTYLKYLTINRQVWHKVQNHIIATTGNTSIICPLDRLAVSTSEYVALHSGRYKTKLKARVNLLFFLNAMSLGIKFTECKMLLDQYRIDLTDDCNKYSVKVGITDFEVTPDFNEKVVMIPSALGDVTKHLGAKYKFLHKGTFMVLIAETGEEVVFN